MRLQCDPSGRGFDLIDTRSGTVVPNMFYTEEGITTAHEFEDLTP